MLQWLCYMNARTFYLFSICTGEMYILYAYHFQLCHLLSNSSIYLRLEYNCS